ncbi:MAG: hypothetical protein Kow00123_07340 [Anaerolineales bacterium]
MRTRRFLGQAIGILLVIAMATALVGCGGGAKSTPAPTATPRPTPTPVPTDTPTPQPEPTAAEPTELDSLISHLARLAPVRVESVLSSQEGDNPPTINRTVAEIDAAGNQRIQMYEGDNLTVEILVVQNQMYMKSEGDQYLSMGESNDPWSALMLYGGAFLLVFNDLQQAEFVGKEQVNGFSTNKYRVQVDLSQFGLSGFVAGQQGAVLEYQGFAWVEMNAMALVKGETLYRAKSTSDEKVTEIRTTFNAQKADIPAIEKPTNILGM